MGGMFQAPEQAFMTPYLFQALKLEYANLVGYFTLTFLVFSLQRWKAKVRRFSVSFLQPINCSWGAGVSCKSPPFLKWPNRRISVWEHSLGLICLRRSSRSCWKSIIYLQFLQGNDGHFIKGSDHSSNKTSSQTSDKKSKKCLTHQRIPKYCSCTCPECLNVISSILQNEHCRLCQDKLERVQVILRMCSALLSRGCCPGTSAGNAANRPSIWGRGTSICVNSMLQLRFNFRSYVQVLFWDTVNCATIQCTQHCNYLWELLWEPQKSFVIWLLQSDKVKIKWKT